MDFKDQVNFIHTHHYSRQFNIHKHLGQLLEFKVMSFVKEAYHSLLGLTMLVTTVNKAFQYFVKVKINLILNLPTIN